MAAGASLSREEYERLSLTSSIKLSDLSGIRKITAPEERSFVIEALAEGKAATVKAARKAYLAARGEVPAPLSETDRDLARLMDAWDRAGESARVGFLAERGDAVRALLDEIGRGDRT
jgi:ParB family chromosome partitioning protein